MDLPEPPPIVECENCNLPAPASDTLCPHCGAIISDSAYDALR